MTIPFDKARPSRKSIEDFAASLEPKLAAAFLASVKAISDAASLKALAAAIATGDVNEVFKVLGIYTDPQLAPFRTALRDAIQQSGAAAAAALPAAVIPRLGRLDVAFDMLNPRTIAFVRDYELALIRQINEQQRAVIRNVLLDALRAGTGPRQAAVAVKQSIGLTDRMWRAVNNFRSELETFHLRRSADAYGIGSAISRAPGGAQVWIVGPDGKPIDGILARRLRDFRYDRTLARALETGQPIDPARIDAMVEAYTRKYRKFRSEMIARTEAIRATNAGQIEMWRQMAEQGLVQENRIRRVWIVARDERTCEICSPIPGMNEKGVGLRQAFKTPSGPIMYPPVHPSCRCTTFTRVTEPIFEGVA